MEWQQIVGFYHLVKLGSFTRAAEVTFRTQSALSQQIKNLEEELGCQLVERIGKKKLRLTLVGEKLLDFSKHVLERHEHLIDSINEIKGKQTGRLRLTAPFNTLYYLLPGYIERFRQRFPGVELKVMDRPPLSVVELVREGEVDLALAMEYAAPKDLIIRPWKKGEYILVVPKDHPLLNVKKASLEQIAQYPLIMPNLHAKSSVSLKVLRLFETHGINYNIAMESSNALLSLKYIEIGVGISLFLATQELRRKISAQLKIIPLDHHLKPEYIALIMRKDKLLGPIGTAFVDILFETHNRSPATFGN